MTRGMYRNPNLVVQDLAGEHHEKFWDRYGSFGNCSGRKSCGAFRIDSLKRIFFNPIELARDGIRSVMSAT